MKKSTVIVLISVCVVSFFLMFVFPFISIIPVEVSAEENEVIVAEYTFEKGEIQFITSRANSYHSYWEADVYFPEIEEKYSVTIPDSVMDDISVGWVGYFGFKPNCRNPQWVGLNYNP